MKFQFSFRGEISSERGGLNERVDACKYVCVCVCVRAAVEMVSSEPAAGADRHQRVSRLLDRIRGATVRAFRGGDHVRLVPRRRADAHPQDADSAAHRLQPHRRYIWAAWTRARLHVHPPRVNVYIRN